MSDPSPVRGTLAALLCAAGLFLLFTAQLRWGAAAGPWFPPALLIVGIGLAGALSPVGGAAVAAWSGLLHATATGGSPGAAVVAAAVAVAGLRILSSSPARRWAAAGLIGWAAAAAVGFFETGSAGEAVVAWRSLPAAAALGLSCGGAGGGGRREPADGAGPVVTAPHAAPRLAGPGVRAGLLTAVFLLPLAVIGGRVAFIQLTCGDAVLAGRDRPTAREEAVPAADGRVLSADGRVWAWDEARFEVHVHYRWLQSEPHPDWLAARVRDRLTAAERKKRCQGRRRGVRGPRGAERPAGAVGGGVRGDGRRGRPPVRRRRPTGANDEGRRAGRPRTEAGRGRRGPRRRRRRRAAGPGRRRTDHSARPRPLRGRHVGGGTGVSPGARRIEREGRRDRGGLAGPVPRGAGDAGGRPPDRRRAAGPRTSSGCGGGNKRRRTAAAASAGRGRRRRSTACCLTGRGRYASGKTAPAPRFRRTACSPRDRGRTCG